VMRSQTKGRQRRLTKQDLRILGVQPGLVVTRYSPGGKRVTVEELTAEASGLRRRFAGARSSRSGAA
jgi:hypothetical protein